MDKFKNLRVKCHVCHSLLEHPDVTRHHWRHHLEYQVQRCLTSLWYFDKPFYDRDEFLLENSTVDDKGCEWNNEMCSHGTCRHVLNELIRETCNAGTYDYFRNPRAVKGSDTDMLYHERAEWIKEKPFVYDEDKKSPPPSPTTQRAAKANALRTGPMRAARNVAANKKTTSAGKPSKKAITKAKAPSKRRASYSATRPVNHMEAEWTDDSEEEYEEEEQVEGGEEEDEEEEEPEEVQAVVRNKKATGASNSRRSRNTKNRNEAGRIEIAVESDSSCYDERSVREDIVRDGANDRQEVGSNEQDDGEEEEEKEKREKTRKLPRAVYPLDDSAVLEISKACKAENAIKRAEQAKKKKNDTDEMKKWRMRKNEEFRTTQRSTNDETNPSLEMEELYETPGPSNPVDQGNRVPSFKSFRIPKKVDQNKYAPY